MIEMKEWTLPETGYAEMMRTAVEPYLARRETPGYCEREAGRRIFNTRYLADGPRGGAVISHGFTETGGKIKLHILVVEDEPAIRQEMKLLLENALYQVTALEEFGDVAARALDTAPDLVLLDVNLPGEAGFDVCTKIRSASEVPIIFVTGRTDSMDELTGLMKGGDDYITKPFQAPLLLAHIAAVLKRTVRDEKDLAKITHKGVELDAARGCLVFRGQDVELTKNELKIMHYLFLNKGNIVPRRDLIDYLWDNQVFIDDNTLSVNVARIRAKLEQAGVHDYITTKRGLGYFI